MRIKRLFFTFLTSSTLFLAGCIRGPYDGGMGGSGHMMGYWYYGGFMWLIFFVVAGVAVYLLIKNGKLGGVIAPRTETALDILKKRYAKGEINKEEYEQKKKDLES
jgi:putative membrane protein